MNIQSLKSCCTHVFTAVCCVTRKLLASLIYYVLEMWYAEKDMLCIETYW